MAINLKQEYSKLRRHLKQRVREYPVYENLGLGRDDDSISMITAGFDFDQSGWVALVFDTRPKASPDGEWNGYIDDNLLDCEH